MFERFTDRARRVMVLAQETARVRSDGEIGPVHILIGVATEPNGVGHQALHDAGITPERITARLRDPQPGAPVGSPPFTAGAKKTLELSVREATQRGTGAITTGHLLLALLTPGLPDIEPLLAPLTDIDALRHATIELLADGSGELLAREGAPGRSFRRPAALPMRDAITELVDAVQRLADSAPPDIAADVTAVLTRVRSLLINTAEGAPIGTMIHTITEHHTTMPRGPAWAHRANHRLRHIAPNSHRGRAV